MKLVLIAAIAALLAALPESATAQAFGKRHAPAKPETGGVESITPQEAPAKITSEDNGWTGAYVGVNAGGGFGKAKASSVVVPFGTSGKSEK